MINVVEISPYTLHATSDIRVVTITVVNVSCEEKYHIGTKICKMKRNQKRIGDHDFLHFDGRGVPDEVY